MMESLGFDWSVFYSVLFLQGRFFDGIKVTLALALSVWVIGIIAGFLLAEVKFVIPKVARCLVNFILWFLKSIPVLVLIYYFYLSNFFSADDYRSNIFLVAVSGMSFWAAANIADIFYRYLQYRALQFKDQKTDISCWIVLPELVRFLATIVTVTPLIIFIGGKDFLSIVYFQIEITVQPTELLLATILVYLILTGVITLIAKLLEKILKAPSL